MKRECAQNFAKSLGFRDESNALEQCSLRVSFGAVIVVAFTVPFFFVLLFFILFFFFGPFSKQDPDGHRAINWVASDEFWRYPAHRLIVHLAPLPSAAIASDEGRSGMSPRPPSPQTTMPPTHFETSAAFFVLFCKFLLDKEPLRVRFGGSPDQNAWRYLHGKLLRRRDPQRCAV
jgi:hypothetical protein